MKLANPIYDAVFKYLMEDTEIARRFLARIIDEEIVEISLRPQEYSGTSPKHELTLFRLDFKATIKLKKEEKKKKDKNWQANHKTVLIELQKAKQVEDLGRFRRYLGDNYRKTDEITLPDGSKNQVELPIVTIYFLGFPMPPVETSALKINRIYTDLITHQVLNVKTKFVELLTHDCFVILISKLPPKERSELERILKVFNQSYAMYGDNKFLEISEEEIKGDELLEMVAKRLRKGAMDEELLREIEIEEEVDEMIDQYIREMEDLKERIKKRDEKIKQRDENLKQKDVSLKQKDESLKQKDEKIQEHERLIEELKRQLKDRQ